MINQINNNISLIHIFKFITGFVSIISFMVFIKELIYPESLPKKLIFPISLTLNETSPILRASAYLTDCGIQYVISLLNNLNNPFIIFYNFIEKLISYPPEIVFSKSLSFSTIPSTSSSLVLRLKVGLTFIRYA